MLKKIFLCLGFLCAGLHADWGTSQVDEKSLSIQSYYQLPYNDEGGRIITTIITNMGEEGYWSLFRKKGHMDRLGDKIEYAVHPLRFLGHIFADPKLKQYMIGVRRDPLKWRGFMGSFKRRGVVKNMHREFRKGNVVQHLHGFCQHVGADYSRVYHYVADEDYHGLVKYLIKHQ